LYLLIKLPWALIAGWIFLVEELEKTEILVLATKA